MSGHNDPPAGPELTALEAALRQLPPRPAEVDREALFFRAGAASARPGWLWPLLTLVSSTTAAALAGVLLLRPAPVIERVVYVPVPVKQPEAPAVIESTPEPPVPDMPQSGSPQRRLQEHLLRWGLDGLGERPPDPPPTQRKADYFSILSSGDSP